MTLTRRFPHGAAALVVAVVLCSLIACSDPPKRDTRVVVRVYVEAEIRAVLHSVRYRIASSAGNGEWTERELTELERSSIERYPIDITVVPPGGDIDALFEVVIDALDADGEPLVQTRAISGFVEEEERLFELWLELCGNASPGDLCESDPNCFGQACSVCVAGACAAETVIIPPEELLVLVSTVTPDPDKPNPVRPVSPCASGPCDNGGTCTPNGRGFLCECEPGFVGARCEVVAPDVCDPNPCENGGTCTGGATTGATCRCLEGYSGSRCATVDPCLEAPCANGGTCSASPDGGFTCACAEGFIGATCETVDPCFSGPCDNGGSCSVSAMGGFVCACPDGWEGTICEVGNPCWDGPCGSGLCRVVTDTVEACTCVEGGAGPNCGTACAVTSAAGPPAADEVNLLWDAFGHMPTHAPDCDGPCLSDYAMDGVRCADPLLAPRAQSLAGDAFYAEWSGLGARRIDRIEIYVGAGDTDFVGEVRVDGFPVGTYDANTDAHALLFDPPLYGSSIEIVRLSGTAPLSLAEVEVWGKDGPPLRNVALHGAARQSSHYSLSEVWPDGGALGDVAASNAVDGLHATVAKTKSFLRGGSRQLEDIVSGVVANSIPYDTGNLDEAPTVGRADAWWYIDLDRGQRVHRVEVVRGANPGRLDGAELYLEVGGALQTPPQLLGSGGADDTVVFSTPVDDVTGVKIVSAIASRPFANRDPAASLELRQVRVWADVPASGGEPLRDLSFGAEGDIFRADSSPPGWPAVSGTPVVMFDGNPASGAGSNGQGNFVRVYLGGAHELVGMFVLTHPSYPGDFFYTPPGQGCPYIPLCGDTYGACSRRMLDVEAFVLDADGQRVGGALHNFDGSVSEFVPLSTTGEGIELSKVPGSGMTSTQACPFGYQSQAFPNAREWRVYGHPLQSGSELVNYASLAQDSAGTLSPVANPDLPMERALDAWRVDYAETGGTGLQTMQVVLRRPVPLTSVRIIAPAGADVAGAALEVRVDGGAWVGVGMLGDLVEQELALGDDLLVSAVRVTRMDTPLRISELQALAPLSH